MTLVVMMLVRMLDGAVEAVLMVMVVAIESKVLSNTGPEQGDVAWILADGIRMAGAAQVRVDAHDAIC